MKRIEITRLYELPMNGTTKQTIGELIVVEDNKIIFDCKTLELPNIDDKNKVSCIPAGEYRATKYHSPTKGEVLLLHNVYGRSMIEIHYGNYYTQILGCILVGDSLGDVNNDGLTDVLNSKKTLAKLLESVDSEVEVLIKYR